MPNTFHYDIEKIKKAAKKKAGITIATIAISVLIAIASTALIIAFGDILTVFIVCSATLVLSILAIGRGATAISKISFTETCGNIEHIHLDVKHVNKMKTANFNLVRAPHSDYWKAENRVTVFIKEDEKITSFQLNNISKKLVDYYEERGEAIHIKATRYPVRIEECAKEFLCPICGSFSSSEDKKCISCKNIILK